MHNCDVDFFRCLILPQTFWVILYYIVSYLFIYFIIIISVIRELDL